MHVMHTVHYISSPSKRKTSSSQRVSENDLIGGGSGGAGGARAPPTFQLGVLSTPIIIFV